MNKLKTSLIVSFLLLISSITTFAYLLAAKNTDSVQNTATRPEIRNTFLAIPQYCINSKTLLNSKNGHFPLPTVADAAYLPSCPVGYIINVSILKERNIYISYLDYPSLTNLKQQLQQKKLTKKTGTTIPAYSTVLNLLMIYDPSKSNAFKEEMFNVFFSDFVNIDSKDREYYIRIAHALWLEKNGQLTWSLKNYSKDEISLLFWVDGIEPNKPPLVKLSSVYYDFDSVGTKPYLRFESSFKLYNLTQKFKFKQSTVFETVLAIIRWQKKNFFHAYNYGQENAYGWNLYKDDQTPADTLNGLGSSIYLPKSLERLFDERITGCHENSYLIGDYLRTLNIPALSLNYLGHGIVYIPKLDKYIHGDHIADIHLALPIDYLFDLSDMNSLLSSNVDYDQLLRKKYPFPKHYFVNTELLRNDKNLYLYTNSVTGINIPSTDWKIMETEVPEFNLKYDKIKGISSDSVPILSLDALSL